MPLEPFHGASLSSKLRNNLLRTFPGAAASRLLALFLAGSGVLMRAQQPPVPQPQGPQPQVQNQQLPQPAQPIPQQTGAPTAPPPEISTDDPDYGEPVSFYMWKTSGRNTMLPGTAAAVPSAQILALPNFSSLSPAGFVSMPAGKFNHLEISYFQADGSGAYTTPIALSLFGSNFGPGTLMSNSYRLRNAQLTWNFLNWPAPPEDSKFRIRSLWGFDYTRINATLDAPLDLNPSFSPGYGTKQIFYPTFGVELEYLPSKHLYIETRAWGFGFPQHADIADLEGNIVAKVKQVELFGGYKWFHFKTQKATDEYFVGTLSGPVLGARWVFK